MALEFQIYDFLEDHEEENESSSSDEENSGGQVYIIHTFGRTEDGKSVYMKVRNYTPYFYIKLPERWSYNNAKKKVKKMREYFESSNFVSKSYSKHLITIKIVEKMSPEGFNNGKKFLFAQLIFNNYKAMKSFRYKFETKKISFNKKNYFYEIKSYDAKEHEEYPNKLMINNIKYDTTHIIKLNGKFKACILKDKMIAIDSNDIKFYDYKTYINKIEIPGVTTKPYLYKTYEANLPPMLRCFHIRNISGCLGKC
jgi:hypothetical protein